MKKAIVGASLLALLVPGAAFAGSATDAALGLGAFAVFNQIISGTGIFGVVPASRPLVVPAPPPPLAPMIAPAPVVAPPPVIVHDHRPVYVRPPVSYTAPIHRAYHAPARTVVIEKRIVVSPGHAPKGHAGQGRHW
jgi:hypothetical protein